jgi:hypothetical protein
MDVSTLRRKGIFSLFLIFIPAFINMSMNFQNDCFAKVQNEWKAEYQKLIYENQTLTCPGCFVDSFKQYHGRMP